MGCWPARAPQEVRGALTDADPAPPAREVYLLQRTKGAAGQGAGQDDRLGAPGVAESQRRAAAFRGELRAHRRRRPAHQLRPDHARPQLLAVDNVVICAGQESVRDLEDGLRRTGVEPHVIGGAAVAAELDAKRAIRQGTELAARL